MKVRVTFTVEVSDDARRQIADFYGYEGLASRKLIKEWYQRYGLSMDDDLGAGWIGETLNNEEGT